MPNLYPFPQNTIPSNCYPDNMAGSFVHRIDGRADGEGRAVRPKFKQLRETNFTKKGKLNPRS